MVPFPEEDRKELEKCVTCHLPVSAVEWLECVLDYNRHCQKSSSKTTWDEAQTILQKNEDFWKKFTKKQIRRREIGNERYMKECRDNERWSILFICLTILAVRLAIYCWTHGKYLDDTKKGMVILGFIGSAIFVTRELLSIFIGRAFHNTTVEKDIDDGKL